MSIFPHDTLSIDIKVFPSLLWPRWQMSVSVSFDHIDSAIPCQSWSLGFIKRFIHWSLADVNMLGKFVRSMYNAFKAWAQKGLGLGNLWRKRYDTVLPRDWNFWDLDLLKCLLPLYIINAQFSHPQAVKCKCNIRVFANCSFLSHCTCLSAWFGNRKGVSEIQGSCFLRTCSMTEAHLTVAT